MSTATLQQPKAAERRNRISRHFPLTTRVIRQRELSRMFGTPEEFSEDCSRARTSSEWMLCIAIMRYLLTYGGGISALHKSANTATPSDIDRQVEYLMSVNMLDREVRVTNRGRSAVSHYLRLMAG